MIISHLLSILLANPATFLVDFFHFRMVIEHTQGLSPVLSMFGCLILVANAFHDLPNLLFQIIKPDFNFVLWHGAL